MDKEWLLDKLNEHRRPYTTMEITIPDELNKRLEGFVLDLFSKRGLLLDESDIIAEALSRFLPPADEIAALIESLPPLNDEQPQEKVEV